MAGGHGAMDRRFRICVRGKEAPVGTVRRPAGRCQVRRRASGQAGRQAGVDRLTGEQPHPRAEEQATRSSREQGGEPDVREGREREEAIKEERFFSLLPWRVPLLMLRRTDIRREEGTRN